MKRYIHECKYAVQHYLLGSKICSYYKTYIGAWFYKTYLNMFNPDECAKIVKNIYYDRHKKFV